MIEKELQIVSSLTGINKENIKFSDNGFLSRGYIIDDGRIVFKFKKWSEITYKNEIKILNFVNSLNLNVNLQKVGWVSKDDSYLGIYGVIGDCLKGLTLSDEQCKDYGAQIGNFLKKLHETDFKGAEAFPIKREITAWQERYERSKDILSEYFNPKEIKKMDDFIYTILPKELLALGEKLVFSHGDLGLGNIFVDKNGKIGIIDFSESVYLDESADFMDMEDDKLLKEALDTYGADNVLRQKVALRRVVHPMFVIGTYRDRSKDQILYFVSKLREWLNN